MDDFRFILVAWLVAMLLTEDEQPKTRLRKLGRVLYFTLFILLFIACFAAPQVRELFVWFALFPLVQQVVRFVINKIHDSSRGIIKKEIVLEDDDALL